MRVRFKTTAGTHDVGATFLATNFAPLLDLDKHFMRRHAADGPDAGLHVLPARRHDPHRGAVQRHAGRRTRRAGARSSSARRRRAAEETACARRIVTTWPRTRSGVRPPPADVERLMEFYDQRPQGEELRRRHRDGAGAHPRVAAVHLPHRGGAGDGAKAGQAYRISDIDLASRLSFFLWSTVPDEELLQRGGAGPAEGLRRCSSSRCAAC